MAEDGYNSISNIDISPTVIEAMRQRTKVGILERRSCAISHRTSTTSVYLKPSLCHMLAAVFRCTYCCRPVLTRSRGR